MKIRVIGILLICLSIASLCSCQKVNENGRDNTNSSANTNDNINDDNINDVTLINHFALLIGLTDQEVVNRMGQGTGERENVNDPIVTREYPLHLRDKTLTAIVSYDNKGIVQGVYSFLPDTEKEKWMTYLTEELGKPTKVETGNLNIEDGNYITNALWLVKERVVALFGSHDSLSIQIE